MIDVIWYNASRGNWDSGLLCSIFDKHPDVFIQHNDKKSSCWFEKAIVIVVGCPDIEQLRKFLTGIQHGIVILTSEEDSFFDYKAAIPNHFEIWTQYYSECKGGDSVPKNNINTRLLLGAPNRLKDYKINRHLPKKYLWSFVGQSQNPMRSACIDVLRTLPNGFLHVADSFGGAENGIEYQEYLDIMCQSVFVICPAGSMCVDSFRLYEAMECGAIPITNARAPRDAKDFNYWHEIGIKNVLIQIGDDWQDLEFVLRNSRDLEFEVEVENKWYFDYKQNLEQKLLDYASK